MTVETTHGEAEKATSMTLNDMDKEQTLPTTPTMTWQAEKKGIITTPSKIFTKTGRLDRYPRKITCSGCRQTDVTRTKEVHIDNKNWVDVLLIFLVSMLIPVPNGGTVLEKELNHYCRHCKAHVGSAKLP
eukprot:scaffold1564_cov174-Amphora_coffeaeformis.AAC.18